MNANEIETDGTPQAPEAKRGCANLQWVQPELVRFAAGEASTNGDTSVDGVSLS